MATEIARRTADLGALAFEQPMPASLRQLFERELMEEIGAMCDESDKLTPADRALFQTIAALALDRRFAYHATRGAIGNASWPASRSEPGSGCVIWMAPRNTRRDPLEVVVVDRPAVNFFADLGNIDRGGDLMSVRHR